MLNLESRVDFEEVIVATGSVVEEFHGASRAIVNRAAKPDRRSDHGVSDGFVEPASRCFFDDFLITTLHRTVALSQRDDVASPVAEELNLDVSAVVDAALQKNPGIAKETLAEPGCTFVCSEPWSSASVSQRDKQIPRRDRARLEHHGIADPVRLCEAA